MCTPSLASVLAIPSGTAPTACEEKSASMEPTSTKSPMTAFVPMAQFSAMASAKQQVASEASHGMEMLVPAMMASTGMAVSACSASTVRTGTKWPRHAYAMTTSFGMVTSASDSRTAQVAGFTTRIIKCASVPMARLGMAPPALLGRSAAAANNGMTLPTNATVPPGSTGMAELAFSALMAKSGIHSPGVVSVKQALSGTVNSAP